MIAFLLRRAEIFKRDAEIDLSNGDFDICMFHLEQATQLMIKAKLPEVKGTFEKTHSLRRLLQELARIISGSLLSFFPLGSYRDLVRGKLGFNYISYLLYNCV
jgi:HEPN domain-containing protein